MHDKWYLLLEHLFKSGYMESLRTHISMSGFVPEAKNIFRAYQMSPDDVKICIIGLSPYPKHSDACGIAFAVEDEREFSFLPDSLQVIADSISKDYNDISYEPQPLLQNWQDQGVFLINTALTTVPYNATSHIDLWKRFTQKVVKILDQNRIIFYLLGAEAKKLKEHIVNSTVFESIHPAACKYSNVKFDGKFKQIDDYYYKLHGENIQW